MIFLSVRFWSKWKILARANVKQQKRHSFQKQIVLMQFLTDLSLLTLEAVKNSFDLIILMHLFFEKCWKALTILISWFSTVFQLHKLKSHSLGEIN